MILLKDVKNFSENLEFQNKKYIFAMSLKR